MIDVSQPLLSLFMIHYISDLLEYPLSFSHFYISIMNTCGLFQVLNLNVSFSVSVGFELVELFVIVLPFCSPPAVYFHWHHRLLHSSHTRCQIVLSSTNSWTGFPLPTLPVFDQSVLHESQSFLQPSVPRPPPHCQLPSAAPWQAH